MNNADLASLTALATLGGYELKGHLLVYLYDKCSPSPKRKTGPALSDDEKLKRWTERSKREQAETDFVRTVVSGGLSSGTTRKNGDTLQRGTIRKTDAGSAWNATAISSHSHQPSSLKSIPPLPSSPNGERGRPAKPKCALCGRAGLIKKGRFLYCSPCDWYRLSE